MKVELHMQLRKKQVFCHTFRIEALQNSVMTSKEHNDAEFKDGNINIIFNDVSLL